LSISFQIVTDFYNSFTDILSWKFAFAIKLLIKIPPHLRCVSTLPCEMLMFANRCIPSVVGGFGQRVKAGMHSLNIHRSWRENLTVVTTVGCFWVISCYLPYDRCLATSPYSPYSGKTVHRRPGHARHSSCCNGRRPHSSHLTYVLRIAHISTQ